MTQEIITYIIGAFVLGVIIHKLYNIVRGKGSADKCSGCSGCALKDELKKKEQACCEHKPLKK